MNELDVFALKYGTDKSSEFHNYTETYNKVFNQNRNEIKSLLEIGIFKGNSLRMWRDYFKNATIYGIDINPDYKFTEERITTIIGNQTDGNIVGSIPDDLDVIIDDGGHQSIQQIESFKHFFRKLKSGGIYVVEDCCCSYWGEYNVNSKQTAVEYFKTLIDQINFNGYRVNNSVRRDRNFIIKNKENVTEFEKNVECVVFFNSLILIKKI